MFLPVMLIFIMLFPLCHPLWVEFRLARYRGNNVI
ncbi:Uncharacterised protein [Vibrio cholerae]|nr:Uncharacterised protein [Vibrio cholerae]